MNEHGTLFEAGLNGTPLRDIDVVDVHAHYGKCFQFNMPHYSAGDLLSEMGAIGIDLAFLNSFRALAGDAVLGNSEVHQVCEQYPERFRMYFVVNPHRAGELDGMFEPYKDSPFLAGLKIHAEIHRCPLAHDAYRWAWETASERGCPLLIHTFPPRDLEAVPLLADEFSEATFLIAHHFGPENLDRALPLVRDKANICVDTCVSSLPMGTIERLVAELGEDRVLFGTDMPYLNAGGQTGKVLLSELSENVKQKLLSGNAKRLFGSIAG